jgi:hypothetical protein
MRLAECINDNKLLKKNGLLIECLLYFLISYDDIIIVGFGRKSGPGSSVGRATGYGLAGPGIESRWGARFSAPVQRGPGAHSASHTTGTGSFPGVKSGRSVTLTSHPF